ncbi:MAG: efflux RND transporter periplasmic adaptor subunit [Bryobacterales bacterium]|nr:efflux RND transporter periplasmic adaptor subunit [Bryobacterales bacterium]MBV9397917.1 efflux RND transporter periplasmic adaptor subunit [Bryobacterales bacterium]
MKKTNLALLGAAVILGCVLASCGNGEKVEARNPGAVDSANGDISVGVAKVGRKTLERTLTLSSELVPFQEIDVYAKEAGYVKDLTVDYGTHVKAGQVMATLEIPELQAQLKQDDAAIQSVSDQVMYAQNALTRIEAQHKSLQLQFERLSGVSKSKPGLVAQQEVDDAEAKALASAAQIEEAKSNIEAARSRIAEAKAKKEHDQVLFEYAKITAPFSGVVTQRYANQGTLMQAGTNSSTQATPLVRLSQDDLFRLVIPVPESYVRYIHVGDPVSVFIGSLNRKFPGRVQRFAVDVKEDTRTMHTEVDVPNPDRVLLPGLYAEATITLERKANTLAVPIQAVNQGEQNTVDVVTPSNTIEIRAVTLGIQTANDAEVLSGLKEGDLIVVSDRSGLKAGQQVQPKVIELVGVPGQEENK